MIESGTTLVLKKEKYICKATWRLHENLYAQGDKLNLNTPHVLWVLLVAAFRQHLFCKSVILFIGAVYARLAEVKTQRDDKHL